MTKSAPNVNKLIYLFVHIMHLFIHIFFNKIPEEINKTINFNK